MILGGLTGNFSWAHSCNIFLDWKVQNGLTHMFVSWCWLSVGGYTLLSYCLEATKHTVIRAQVEVKLSDKESVCQCKRFRFNPWVRKIPWRRK